MQLRELQSSLERRYDVNIPYRVDQFFCNDTDTIRSCLGRMPGATEMLLIHEDGDNLDLTLYIDKKTMSRVDAANWEPASIDRHFNAYCAAIEGVSHFVYLTWNAGHNKSVKLLEMEIQAEVDKFVVTATNCLPDTAHRALLTRLFDNIRYRDDLSDDEQHRYEQANALACQYCHWLLDSFSLDLASRGLRAELARFYRMNSQRKIAHIRERVH
jgi:hypothetical protein